LLSYLTENNISAISGDAFVNVTALHTLDLSYNDLEGVPNSLLTASSSWRVLDFSHNGILDVPSGIRKAVVEGYMYEFALCPDHAMRAASDSNVVRGCSSFDANALVEIGEDAFAGSSEINELRLASNAIFTVNSRAFSGMAALRKL
jgi:Leucine-rich repeat (LRR) protein